MPKPKPDKSINSYVAIISRIFVENYRVGLSEFVFARKDMATVVESLKIDPPKNYGDVVYTFRYREALPESVRATAMPGFEWIIEGAGRSKYRFKQVRLNRIVPRDELLAIKVPDATPEIIGAYALSDEQALLAKVRYNRLIDIFLGIAAFSLQNHLRTTVKNVGQIEIDEVYVGIDRHGRQFVVPVQAKGGSDKHGSVQTQQTFCAAPKNSPIWFAAPSRRNSWTTTGSQCSNSPCTTAKFASSTRNTIDSCHRARLPRTICVHTAHIFPEDFPGREYP
jgi:hypothetical protein